MKVKPHRFTPAIAAGLGAAALAAPAAVARPAALDPPPQPIDPAPAPLVQSVDDGFDWGSAAIGAGGAGALVLLVSAGGITLRHRHERVRVAR